MQPFIKYKKRLGLFNVFLNNQDNMAITIRYPSRSVLNIKKYILKNIYVEHLYNVLLLIIKNLLK